ncbi:hypothetical protein scyTo_0010579, partial [Scyliorhinus torazame]|nr:hypothetical protein [Scyliorhinus torazame]
PEFAHLGALKPLPVCEFEMEGPEGIIESKQVVQEGKANPTEAVDCKWYIRAPPKSKVSVVPSSTSISKHQKLAKTYSLS